MKTALYLSCSLCLLFATLLMVGYCGATRLTPEMQTQGRLKQIGISIHVYYQKYKKLPKNLDEIPKHPNQKKENYLKDYWGRKIRYQISNGKIQLQSETDKTLIHEIPLEEIYDNLHSFPPEFVEDYYRGFRR